MNAKLDNSTVKRVEEAIDEPISRGMDKAINQCLDELDELRKKENANPRVMTCDRMEELVNGE